MFKDGLRPLLLVALFVAVITAFTLMGTQPEAAQQTTAVGPAGFAFCSNEDSLCAFSGTLDVAYGYPGAFVVKTLFGGTACNNAVFGNPGNATSKHCWVRASAPPPVPPPPVVTTVGPPTGIQCTASFALASVVPGQPNQVSVTLNCGGVVPVSVK